MSFEMQTSHDRMLAMKGPTWRFSRTGFIADKHQPAGLGCVNNKENTIEVISKRPLYLNILVGGEAD